VYIFVTDQISCSLENTGGHKTKLDEKGCSLIEKLTDG
jgi:hypothetical protein